LFFGKYDFKAPKPWLQLLTDPGLNITDEEMQQIVQPFKHYHERKK
jgi:hypothetical protein